MTQVITQIDAVFRRGVFEPLEPVKFQEEQRVRLNVEAEENENLKSWLEEVRAMHAAFLSERGPLPDSTPDIAADRMR